MVLLQAASAGEGPRTLEAAKKSWKLLLASTQFITSIEDLIRLDCKARGRD